MTEPAIVFLIVVLHELGKAGTHAVRDRPWARRPLVADLALSDLYHVLSGLQWLAVLTLCASSYGTRWAWWLATIAAWAVLWPASKLLKYDHVTWRTVWAEAWYAQVYHALRRRLPWTS